MNQIADLFGFIAAGLGVITFLPQAISIYKTKNTKSISLQTFVILSVQCLFWLVYGFFPVKLPVIIVNCAVLTLSAYIVLMKLKYK